TILVACSDDRTYYLEVDDAKGIESGAKVVRQGIEIGEVDKVEFAEDKVKITIETEEPLFEDQDFRIARDDEGDRELIFRKPSTDAEELESGATIEGYSFGDADIDLDGLDDLGETLGNAFERAFGPDGENMQDFANQMEAVARQFGARAEAFGEVFEEWAEENGDKLEDLGNQMEEWAEEYGDEMEDFGEEMERISEKYEIGSKKWKEEMERALKELKKE
ncbi:MAG: MlaD family protein, partial [Bacteroidota bacterium]